MKMIKKEKEDKKFHQIKTHELKNINWEDLLNFLKIVNFFCSYLGFKHTLNFLLKNKRRNFG